MRTVISVVGIAVLLLLAACTQTTTGRVVGDDGLNVPGVQENRTADVANGSPAPSDAGVPPAGSVPNDTSPNGTAQDDGVSGAPDLDTDGPHITDPPVSGPASNAGAMLAGNLTVRSMVVDYGPAQGFYVEPETVTDGQEYPGVVLIHEWWGQNDGIRQAASALASHGYRVLAVDLYNGTVAQDPQEAMRLVRSIDQEQATLNLRAATGYLRTRGSQRIASYGWCFGGAQSLQLALSGEPLDATVIYYGQLETDPQRLRNISWPVLGIFGAQDESIPVSQVRQFNASLEQAGVEREIRIYDGVGHAFANPSGANYAPQQTADAWNRTLAFLDETLR